MITEEIWFFWSLIIISIYIYIIYRWFMIASFVKKILGNSALLALHSGFSGKWSSISVLIWVFSQYVTHSPIRQLWWLIPLMMLLAGGILLSISREVEQNKKAFQISCIFICPASQEDRCKNTLYQMIYGFFVEKIFASNTHIVYTGRVFYISNRTLWIQ